MILPETLSGGWIVLKHHCPYSYHTGTIRPSDSSCLAVVNETNRHCLGALWLMDLKATASSRAVRMTKNLALALNPLLLPAHRKLWKVMRWLDRF